MKFKDLTNPWPEISSADYELHMSHASVMQLQTLSAMVQEQYQNYLPKKLAYLGIGPGNGLEHMHPKITETIYGLDINQEFLSVCEQRFASKFKDLILVPIDLNVGYYTEDRVNLIIANLVLEFVDYERFAVQLDLLAFSGTVASIIFQVKNSAGVVSNSGVTALQVLSGFSQEVSEEALERCMTKKLFSIVKRQELMLLDGKVFVRVDYLKE